MSNRKDQPAQLKRRIAYLERLIEVERERAEKAWEGYRKALYENVDIKLRLEAVEKALRGDE
jgi:hypothetical protein